MLTELRRLRRRLAKWLSRRGRRNPPPREKPPQPKAKRGKSYAERAAPFQREGEDYLRLYWNSYEAPRFTAATAFIRRVAEAKGTGSLSLFDFGCGAGALIRRVHTELGGSYGLTLAGADVDRKALAFLKEMIPTVTIVDADPRQLRDIGYAASHRFDVCAATAVLVALRERDVHLLLDDFATMADAVVIVDQVENLDGAGPVTVTVSGPEGDREAIAYPLATWLRQRGFTEIEVAPLADKRKGATGALLARRPG